MFEIKASHSWVKDPTVERGQLKSCCQMKHKNPQELVKEMVAHLLDTAANVVPADVATQALTA